MLIGIISESRSRCPGIRMGEPLLEFGHESLPAGPVYRRPDSKATSLQLQIAAVCASESALRNFKSLLSACLNSAIQNFKSLQVARLKSAISNFK
jgi:hypothetical protein